MTYKYTRPDFTLHIPLWIIHDLKLKGAERDVYAAIYAFTFEGGVKRLEWDFLAEFTGTSKASCRRAVDNLMKKGLVEKFSVITKFGERNEFRAIVPSEVIHNVNRGGAQNEHPPLPKMSTPPAQNEHHKLNINKIKTIKETGKEKELSSAPCPRCGSQAEPDMPGFCFCQTCDVIFKVS